MIKRLLVIVLLVFLFAACDSLENPNGFVGVKNIDPPKITILSPSAGTDVKGVVEFQIKISHHKSTSYVHFYSDGYWANATLRENKDGIHYFDVDLSSFKGTLDVKVSTKDFDGLEGISSVQLNITQLIKNINVGTDDNRIGLYTMKECRNGNLWFGTDEGLFKYDGKNLITEIPGFEDYYSPVISTFTFDNENKIWMQYRSKYSSATPLLLVFDGYSVVNKGMVPIWFSVGSVEMAFSDFEMDSKDQMWGLFRGGYFKYSNDDWERNVINDDLYEMVIDKNDNKIFIRNDDVVIFDGENWIYTNSPSKNPYNLIVDNNNNYWITFLDEKRTKKIAQYNGSDWIIHDYIPENISINCFDIDNEGSIWIAGKGGVYKFSNKEQKFYTYFLNTPSKILVDNWNNVWVLYDSKFYLINENGF